MKRINQSVMTIVAACLLAATPMWTETSRAEAANIAKEQQAKKSEISKEVQSSLDKLFEQMPELKTLRLEEKFLKESNFRDYPNPVWNVMLTNRPETGAEKNRTEYATASIELDAQTGRLLFLDIRNPDWASANYPDEKLAREKADEFLHKWLGKETSSLKQSQAMGRGKAGRGSGETGKMIEWARSSVYYQTLINEIPLNDYSLVVSVDHAGHIVRYDAYRQIQPDEAKWPAPEKAISPDKAKQLYQEQLKMQLEYVAEQPTAYAGPGRPSEKKPMLIYQANEPFGIDAVTGKVVGEDKIPEQQSVRVKGGGKSVKIASKAEGEQWLKEQFGIDVAGADFEYDDHKENLTDGLQQIESYHWLNFSGKSASSFDSISLTTDAVSDRLIGFNLHLPDGRKQGKTISIEEAKKKAIAALEPYVDPSLAELTLFVRTDEAEIPDWVDKSKLHKQDEPQEYSFHFQGKRDGIPVSDEFYGVEINKETGAIAGLNLHPIQPGIVLPDAGKIVSEQEAKEAYQQEVELELNYYWDQYEGQRAPEPQLIYQTKEKNSYRFIDATTGKIITVKYR
ncbi:YcdB/YcdC domain-containing protein [Brevibacillus sp. FSL K6-0770]|uniref:YcdB/YcdC domain-containing protein n=1 Tax=Brevibacillus sp. FSL K6-0770 TaxID=2954673 RepID=UPI0030FB0A5D